jgi:O-methyltransferase involved in polyketide biosynthesis
MRGCALVLRIPRERCDPEVAAETSPEQRLSAEGLDVTVPHSARIWNYWLGGKDNFSIDRRVGEQLKETYPAIVDLARTDRQFLGRVVRYLAGEAGIRQFLDIGSGLPTVDNTHEVAQRVAPESRVAYVDSDPMVLIHAKALLTSSPEGACDYIEADFRTPDAVLAAAAATLDFTRPVAVMLLGMLGHFSDDDEVVPLIRRVMAATAPGSYLVIAHGSSTSSGLREAARRYRDSGADPYTLRSPGQLAGFFEGLELVPPGLVPVPQWRPDPASGQAREDAFSYCAVGRKLS